MPQTLRLCNATTPLSFSLWLPPHRGWSRSELILPLVLQCGTCRLDFNFIEFRHSPIASVPVGIGDSEKGTGC